MPVEAVSPKNLRFRRRFEDLSRCLLAHLYIGAARVHPYKL